MLLPSNASALLLNSATSIWSSVDARRLVLVGDLRQRVAALHRVRVRRRRSARRRRAPAAPRAAAAARGRAAPARAGVDRLDRRAGDRRRARRIEQERVVAHDAAGRPVDLDQQVEVRLVDGRRRRDPEVRRCRSASRSTRDARARRARPGSARLFCRYSDGIGDLRAASESSSSFAADVSSIRADSGCPSDELDRQLAEAERARRARAAQARRPAGCSVRMGFARIPTPSENSDSAS